MVTQMPDDPKTVQEVEDLKRAARERDAAQKAADAEKKQRSEDDATKR
jgi:hypothetical protein